jgi:hypothetical protein
MHEDCSQRVDSKLWIFIIDYLLNSIIFHKIAARVGALRGVKRQRGCCCSCPVESTIYSLVGCPSLGIIVIIKGFNRYFLANTTSGHAAVWMIPSN